MSDRSDKWHATRRARELALFAGQRFEVVREVKGESFKTPLGYSAKNGYEVRNVESGDTFKVGKTTLKVMAAEYDAVTLPAPKKRGRPKKVQFAEGGFIQGPGTGESDQIPAILSDGYVIKADKARELYGSELIERMNAMSTDEAREQTEFTPKIENANEPGAHPVAEEPTDDARSGSLAGPTYPNPNEDEEA